MNQSQRDYLIKKIEGTFKSQSEALEEAIPEKPEMNRYLIGAFLDGSIKILDAKKIKSNLTSYVKKLGSKDFVETESDYRYRRGGRNREIEIESIKIDPATILEVPKTYTVALDEWKKAKAVVDKKIKDLNAQREVLILKIQIGSNQILDKLITQVDSLGDLDLFSNKLTLIAENIDEKKLLTNSKK